MQQPRCALRNSRVASSATPQVSWVAGRFVGRADYSHGVDHVEVAVRYADDSVGTFCLVPDADGLCALTMPAGAAAVESLHFVKDLAASEAESRTTGGHQLG